MNTFETICRRRSVRSYTGQGVTPEELQKLLTAANAAPVGMGQYDGVHLTVVTRPELLEKIDRAGAALFGKPDMHPLYGAPLFLLISTRVPAPGMENVAYSNAAIIAHNVALEAVELGIGTCYIWGAVAAVAASPELMGELELPEGFLPCCGLVLGRTDCRYELRDIPLDRISANTIA